MNKIEFWLMNNPIRTLSQQFEARKLREMSDLSSGKEVLEIGCGQGEGTKLIEKYFHPEKIVAIDLDENMIQRAKKRVKEKNITFELGDASKLRFEESTFDAVFDFGIIHHIPNWRDALQEVHRVLKPDGQLILEDLSIDSFETLIGKVLRLFLRHPYQKMYKVKEFKAELSKLEFEMQSQYTTPWWFGMVLRKKSKSVNS